MTKLEHQPFEASAWLVAIVESSHDAIISKDLNGVIQSWNKGAEEVFGYTAEEAIGQPVTMLMPPDRVNEEPGIIARIRSGEKVDHYTTVRRGKDGTLIDISLTVSPIRGQDGTVIGASKIARDITESKRIEGAVRESEIMHRLVQMQEAERARIARDLHDHIGQMLTGIRLKVERLMETTGDDTIRGDILSIREIARKMDHDVGFLSRELRPTELDNLGLVNALGAFVKEWSQQFDIDAEFKVVSGDSDASTNLSREAETNLYRIVQEALNNVVKHARASRVSVLVHLRREGVTLIVEDDGRGFNVRDVPSGDDSHGFGMIGMRERTELLGGDFEVESGPEQGTSILVRVPSSRSAGDGSSVAVSGL
jgi:two-component system sensor histidine kinase UhpB